MNRYTESPLFIDLSTMRKTDTITNLFDAMNCVVTDYTKVPITMYTDWNIIIKRNDSPGVYHNMLSYDKRREILEHIKQYQLANF